MSRIHEFHICKYYVLKYMHICISFFNSYRNELAGVLMVGLSTGPARVHFNIGEIQCWHYRRGSLLIPSALAHQCSFSSNFPDHKEEIAPVRSGVRLSLCACAHHVDCVSNPAPTQPLCIRYSLSHFALCNRDPHGHGFGVTDS